MKTGEIGPDAPGSTTTRTTNPTDAHVTEQAAGAAHSAVDRVAGSAARAEERIREAAASGEGRLKEKRAEARVSTERAMDHVREYTRDNPLAAAGIAFAAGLVVSRLLGR